MNSAQVVAVEVENVRKVLPTLFERDQTFYSTIEKRDVEVVSTRDMRVPLELRPGGKFRAIDIDGGDLGRGDGPSYDKAVISTFPMGIAFEFTAKSDWGNDDSRKGVVKTFQRIVATSMKEMRKQIDSQCLTGGDGVVGTVSAVTNSGGVDTVTLNSDGFGARLVRYGQNVNYYDSTLATNRTTNAARPITFYDGPNKIIKTATTASLQAGDKVVVEGLSATPPVWLQGVPYHHSSASTGTWLGFDRSTTPEIRANRVNASGALALPFARLALNKIGDRVGLENMKKTTAWMHPCQKQAYEELGQLVSLIHKEAKDESLDLYFGDSMQMAGAPVKTHYSWDKTRIDFVVPDVWGRAEMRPVDFFESKDGRKMFEARGASGGVATSTIFYIVAVFNTFVSNPAICAYIDGLTVPTGY